MSVKATEWAWRQPITHPAYKLLLHAMAYHADETGCNCFPSRAALAEKTCLSVATVRRGLGWLRDNGYIRDTGRRTGETGRVVVYRLPLEECKPRTLKECNSRTLKEAETGSRMTPLEGGNRVTDEPIKQGHSGGVIGSNEPGNRVTRDPRNSQRGTVKEEQSKGRARVGARAGAHAPPDGFKDSDRESFGFRGQVIELTADQYETLRERFYRPLAHRHRRDDLFRDVLVRIDGHYRCLSPRKRKWWACDIGEWIDEAAEAHRPPNLNEIAG